MFSVLRRLSGLLTPKRSTRPSIQFDGENVFSVLNGFSSLLFRWADIQEIVTFKRDFFTWDDIRLAFRSGDEWVEVSEESPGWTELIEEMQRRFPAIPDNWLGAVMLPAFETNAQILYRRD